MIRPGRLPFVNELQSFRTWTSQESVVSQNGLTNASISPQASFRGFRHDETKQSFQLTPPLYKHKMQVHYFFLSVALAYLKVTEEKKGED